MKDKYYEQYLLDKYYKRSYLSREIGGYSVVDKDSYGGYGDYVNYKELEEYKYLMERKRRQYEYQEPETAEEKSARLLREKAVERESKIDKLLGNDGL